MELKNRRLFSLPFTDVSFFRRLKNICFLSRYRKKLRPSPVPPTSSGLMMIREVVVVVVVVAAVVVVVVVVAGAKDKMDKFL